MSINKLRNIKYFSCLCMLAIASNAYAFVSSTTSYKYDARGRLIQIADDSGREANYVYDDAGNRVNAWDETANAPADPVMTSFSAPSSVSSYGATATIAWSSTGTTYCSLAVGGNSSAYPNLPVSGTQGVPIYADTTVTLTCFGGGKSTTSGKLIRLITGGGGGGGMNAVNQTIELIKPTEASKSSEPNALDGL